MAFNVVWGVSGHAVLPRATQGRNEEPGSRAMNTQKAPASAGAFSLCIYLLTDAFKAEGLFRQGEADKFQGLFNGDPLVGFGHKSGFVGKLDLRATQKL